MVISVQNAGKKYHREWVFKKLDYTFEQNNRYAITGANGSGKSTLLQVLSGYQLPTTGQVVYTENGVQMPDEHMSQHITMATPYMELIEEFTLQEHLHFHFKFRKIKKGFCTESLIEDAYLSNSKNKYVKNFSSGMKQRLKLALAFYTECAFILLDEPTSNLDHQGMVWYNDKIEEILKTEVTLIIASNQPAEYENYMPNIIEMAHLKP